jgi:hypothetical protein
MTLVVRIAADRLRTLARTVRGRWPIELRDPPAERAADALSRFAALVREARPASELRIALVYLAHRLSGAARAELLIPPAPGCRPVVVARWPSQETEPVPPDAAPVQVPLRIQGLSWGLLRLSPARRRPRPEPGYDGLTALAALAAAAEMAHQQRFGLAGRVGNVPAPNPFRADPDNDRPTPVY